MSAIARWLPTSIFATALIALCLLGIETYIFAQPKLEQLIANGILTKAQMSKIKMSSGRVRPAEIDLTWEGAGKSCRLSRHPISKQAFEDFKQSLASGADQTSVLVDPTGACVAVIVADIPFERKQRSLIPIVAALILTGLGTVIGSLAASRI